MKRLITWWAAEADAGRRTLATDLARLYARESSVLIVSIGKECALNTLAGKRVAPTSPPAPEQWVPRFEQLSSSFLRNYLADPNGSFAHVALEHWPSEPLVRKMVALVNEAYDWVFVLAPHDASPESIALLDGSDLLLWVAQASDRTAAAHVQMLSHLSRLHFPHMFSQVLLNRCAGAPSLPALTTFPQDNAAGLRRKERIRELGDILRDRQALYRVRQTLKQDKAETDDKVQQLKNKIQPELLRVLELQKKRPPNEAPPEADVAQKTVEAFLAAGVDGGGSHEERTHLVTRVLDEVLGLGPLEPLLKDPEISEIMVNGHGRIFIEKKGRLHPTDVQFGSESQLRTVIDRIVAPIGRRVDESMPLCDARLSDGSRVNIILPPLALDGATVTIRKFSARTWSLADLTAFGSMSQPMHDFLEKAVIQRRNIVVAGGTGSGKTTLLNALSSAIPDDERIVTIEDAAELRLQKPHVVRLEARPANAENQGEIPIRRLVMNALRMRPDRIVVGECRGGEALDMLQAMNTGHDGSLTTVHANSPRDALGRLETLVLMAGMDLPLRVIREQIRSAIHVLVQQSRLADGTRKVISITEITGMEGDILTTIERFRFRNGLFEATGF
jgi:pilus assembly protein CpaF